MIIIKYIYLFKLNSFPKSLVVKLFALCFFCIISLINSCKVFGKVSIVEDSIVLMHGYVYDTISENPKKIGVYAKIILESLPHGSEIGIISSKDSTGYYEYFINLETSYRVDIKSDIYGQFTENLNPQNFVIDGEIRRNYYLSPEVKENQVIRLNKLIFAQGKSNFTNESYGELNKLAKLMIQYSTMQIQLEGHTDYRGSKKLNMKLSEDRVEAVKDYLVGKGISSRKIKTKAFGGSKPLIKEKSIEASQINRRVEVRILKFK